MPVEVPGSSEGLGLTVWAVGKLQIAERAAVHAGIQRQFCQLVHAAEAATKRTALMRFKVCPLADPGKLWDSVPVMPNDLKCVAALRHKATMSR